MMSWLSALYADVEALVHTGGDVLLVLFAVALLLWWFIIERLWFFFGPESRRREMYDRISGLHPGSAQTERRDTRRILWLRRRWVSVSKMHAGRGMLAIKGLVAICPLLGLFGTITGMIDVFTTMSLTGNDNARLLSDGISRATYPTFAGLVIALSGFYFISLFEHRARHEASLLHQRLSPPS